MRLQRHIFVVTISLIFIFIDEITCFLHFPFPPMRWVIKKVVGIKSQWWNSINMLIKRGILQIQFCLRISIFLCKNKNQKNILNTKEKVEAKWRQLLIIIMVNHSFLSVHSSTSSSPPTSTTAGRKNTVLSSRAGRWRATLISSLLSRWRKAHKSWPRRGPCSSSTSDT